MDCVFCKIIEGKIPCEKIYEDEHTFAFLTIEPYTPKHTLVVPKAHIRNVLDCPPEILNNVMAAVQKISKNFIDSGYKCVKIIQNNEPPFQEVMHLHFHVIPHDGNGRLRDINTK